MKTKEREKGIFIIALLLIILSVTIVSAGWLDWLKKITGKASSPVPYNISVTVTGANAAQINFVSIPHLSDVNPNEGTNTTVTFSVNMNDSDGANDLNDTSVNATFSKTGESSRSSGTCTLVGDLPDGYTANYSCAINLWYWDGNGTWNVAVQGKDLGDGSWVFNDTVLFNYTRLRAITLSPNELAWSSVIPGAQCQNASLPLTINNTGNYNGTINTTTIDLIGYSDSNFVIYATNFSVNVTESCSGTALANSTSKLVPSTNANRGNLSVGSGTGQEQIYFFIPIVPQVSSQVYDTRKGGSWEVNYPQEG